MRSLLGCCLILITAFCSTTNAEFVIDDFTTGGQGAMTSTGATIDLGGVGSGFTYTGDGYTIDFFSSTVQTITYDYGATTIGEAYGASDPYADTTVNNNIDVITLPHNFGLSAADFSLDILVDGGVHQTIDELDNYPTLFVSGITGASTLGFRFTYNGTGFAPIGSTIGTGGATLFANPEPTSALMFGSIALFGLIRRRKA